MLDRTIATVLNLVYPNCHRKAVELAELQHEFSRVAASHGIIYPQASKPKFRTLKAATVSFMTLSACTLFPSKTQAEPYKVPPIVNDKTQCAEAVNDSKLDGLSIQYITNYVADTFTRLDTYGIAQNLPYRWYSSQPIEKSAHVMAVVIRCRLHPETSVWSQAMITYATLTEAHYSSDCAPR